MAVKYGRWLQEPDGVTPVFDDVAHSLGYGPLQTLRRVTLPLVAPGLGAGSG